MKVKDKKIYLVVGEISLLAHSAIVCFFVMLQIMHTSIATFAMGLALTAGNINIYICQHNSQFPIITDFTKEIH